MIIPKHGVGTFGVLNESVMLFGNRKFCFLVTMFFCEVPFICVANTSERIVSISKSADEHGITEAVEAEAFLDGDAIEVEDAALRSFMVK